MRGAQFAAPKVELGRRVVVIFGEDETARLPRGAGGHLITLELRKHRALRRGLRHEQAAPLPP
jgi:hypothetical protein